MPKRFGADTVGYAIEAGTCRPGDSGWAWAGRPGRWKGSPPPLPMHPCPRLLFLRIRIVSTISRCMLTRCPPHQCGVPLRVPQPAFCADGFFDALHQHMVQFDEDTALRCVVLAAEGRHFSAGVGVRGYLTHLHKPVCNSAMWDRIQVRRQLCITTIYSCCYF